MNRIGITSWRSRPASLIAVTVLLLALVAGFVRMRSHPGKGAQASAMQSAVVQATPFTSTLGVTGVVTPGDVVPVTAPFDGKVNAVGFDFGAPVVQGQMLVTLDTSEVRQRRDEAEAEYLKASQADAEMASWSTGPEVSQARRSESSAQFDLAETTRKIAETKMLLDKGLVARDEYDGLLQQQRSQEMAVVAAHQELAESLKKGDAANRRVASIERETAKARLDALETESSAAVVRAPVSGILVHPPGEKGDSAGQPLHLGMPLSKGQLIGAIAHPGGLAIAFQLSEADADRVRIGQRVVVTGPGFQGVVLTGSIASIAGEATPASGGEGGVTFAGSARLDPLTPAQAAIIRIGMSASVTIDIYRNPAALVAPPAAIQGEAPDTYVMVKHGGGRPPRRVAVRIGHVAPDGVEILSGLKPGDVVIWSGSASSSSDDDSD
jgi:multidrug efflux pump subunit AcrA (membrane-fusion protein)